MRQAARHYTRSCSQFDQGAIVNQDSRATTHSLVSAMMAGLSYNSLISESRIARDRTLSAQSDHSLVTSKKKIPTPGVRNLPLTSSGDGQPQ